ncbi:restriction endonuclease subunit S [Thermus hydrothermalis]|uniref:restriction endonuclease subunit S n=1 Tax=Thermus hydrothermalis TaxID=2908148 RepID=UPI001FAAC12C|nr:restriction endonuclease subunit S [Thermus hydrothermalis]
MVTAINGWIREPISKVAEVNPVTALPGPELDDLAVPFYNMAAIDEYSGKLRDAAIVHLRDCRTGKTKFQNGDVLFAKITPCVQNRKSALVNGLPGNFACGSSEFYVLRPGKRVRPEYLFYFIRQDRVIHAAVESFTGTSGRQRVPRTFWDRLEVPLPPLPVQERIVEILQKADEIRRKRKEALELADKILTALFLEMFGDPATNPKGWQTVQFGDCLLDVTRECNKVQQHEYRNNTSGACPVIDQGEDFIGGYIDDRKLLYQGTLPVILFGDHTRRFKFVDFPFVLGADGTKVLCAKAGYEPEYIYWHLRLARLPDRGYERHFKFVRELRFMAAPLTAQKYFARIVQQYTEQRVRLSDGSADAEATFRSLLSRAFTGELTAKWEVANAEWIAKQQVLYERLPRLVTLALVAEEARSARRSAEVLVTALMKYLFLLQMEGSSTRRRFYHFVPYDYGPFAKELYTDLQKLQDEGLVRVESNPEEEKTKITLTDPARIDEELAELPDDLKQDVATIVKTYGDLDHNNLLKIVYEKYPAYARKSRLRRKQGEGQ